MRYYLVSIKETSEVELINQRISENFRDFYFVGNDCVLKTSIENAQEVYNKIVTPLTNSVEMVVYEIDQKNYWGFANKYLWHWLKEDQ